MLTIFELVKTFEIDPPRDLELEVIVFRIEVYRSLQDRQLYRARLWANEFFRVRRRFTSFSHVDDIPDEADEQLLCDWTWQADAVLDAKPYRAQDDADAERQALDSIERLFERYRASPCIPKREPPSP